MTDNAREERRAFRANRVRLAFLTSAGSKSLGLLVQFLAIPLAVGALGAERFGIYTMLFSALIWIDLGRLGIGPGITREIALAWNRGERERERIIFSNALFFLLSISAAISVILIFGYFWGSKHIEVIFGESASRFRSDILQGTIVVCAFFVAQIVFSAGEAARSAYQDDFINNLLISLANVASLLLLFGVALWWPTVPAFAVAVFGTIALGKGVNLALLILQSRPYLFPRLRYVRKAEIRPLLRSSLAFWMVQVGTIMMHQLSQVQLGQMIGAGGLAPFALVFRLLQLLSTAVLMVSMPLWPAITDASVRGDVEWIRRSYRRLLIFAMTVSGLTALGVAVLGTTLIPLWAGGAVHPSSALNTVLGVYFIIWMWNHCHIVTLFGLGRLRSVAYTILAEGLSVLVLAALWVPHFGDLGTALALCSAGLGISAWILPLVVHRGLASLSAGTTSKPRPPEVAPPLLPGQSIP